MSTIIVLVDPDTREVKIDFPLPQGGVWKPADRPNPGDPPVSAKKPPTLEQLAHHEFWANGTQERINGLIKDGGGAGMRQTIRWLIHLRIAAAHSRTGFSYKLSIISDRAKWESIQNAKAGRAA